MPSSSLKVVPSQPTVTKEFSGLKQSSFAAQAINGRHVPSLAQYSSIPQSSLVEQKLSQVLPHIPSSQNVVPIQSIDMKELSSLLQSSACSQVPFARHSPLPAQYSSIPQSSKLDMHW